MNQNKKISIGIISLTVCLTVSVIVVNIIKTNNDKVYNANGLYFDTLVNITVYNSKDAKVLDGCLEICEKYENLFSRTVENSDVFRINNAKGNPTEVSKETAYLIKESLKYCEMTDGAVDITVAPLCDLWDFTSNDVPPLKEEIDKALGHVNYRNVEVEGNLVTLKDPEASIDLGFIAKGYIADQIKAYMLTNGVQSGIISLGGNVLTIGEKKDGTLYKVGIRKPFGESGECVDTVEVSDRSVVTSGTYERYFEYDGVIYHHIIDARNGYPAQREYDSVTIVSDDSVTGDALSTACFLLGREESEKLKMQAGTFEIYFY